MLLRNHNEVFFRLFIKVGQFMCNTLLQKVTAPWMTVRTIQKEVWMMLDRDTDVNDIVKMLEEKAK